MADNNEQDQLQEMIDKALLEVIKQRDKARGQVEELTARVAELEDELRTAKYDGYLVGIGIDPDEL
jgi:polyhydroxyalkanoate synthesis regulator phasin